MKDLCNPYIPAIYDIEADEDMTYIIEQYIEGVSLGELCKRRLLSEEELFHYFSRICSIISYLHSRPDKICYLDLKPENIIVADGEAYLVDFGSATGCNSERTGTVFGNVGYAAPEQRVGHKPACEADIYALGKLLRYMLEHADISHESERRLKAVSDRCCEPDPNRRIRSADIPAAMIERIQCNRGRRSKKLKDHRPLGRECLRIGVVGLYRGVGTTHIALSIAGYLAEYQGMHVCLKSGDVQCLSGTSGDIIYDAGVSGSDHPTEDFDSVIYDMGTGRGLGSGDIHMCDLKIIVGPAAPWRRGEYGKLSAIPPRELRGWILLVNLADDVQLRSIRDVDMIKYAYPPDRDPLSPGHEATAVLEKIMKHGMS